MEQLGIYWVDKSEDTSLEGYPINVEHWKRSALMCDGKVLVKTGRETDTLGLRRQGDRLVLNGQTVAVSADGKGLHTEGGQAAFGDAKFPSSGRCINITLADYTSLRQGREVTGYSRYDSRAVYNIVADVSSAGEVAFDAAALDGLEDVVLNSFTPHNGINDDNTVKLTDPPELSIRYFDPVVPSGGELVLDYYVDNAAFDSMRRGVIGDKFTVVVKDADGSVMWRRTMYAGMWRVRLPMTGDGRTYISIMCIDSRGVSSVEQYFDVYVVGAMHQERLYEVQQSDLSRFGLVTDSGWDDLEAGYKNRLGINNLIKWAIKEGYNGLKMYNKNPSPGSDAADPFNAEDNSVYYFDMHTNLAGDPSGIDLDDPESTSLDGIAVDMNVLERYWLVKMSGGAIEGITKAGTEWTEADMESLRLHAGDSVQVGGTSYTVGQDVFGWVRKDGAHIFRNAADRIVTRWHSLSDNPDEIYYGDSAAAGCRVLRLYNIARVVQGLNQGTLSKWLNQGDGYYYLCGYKAGHDPLSDRVNWDIPAGDNCIRCQGVPVIVMPDNFVLDWNHTVVRRCEHADLDNKAYLIMADGVERSSVRNCRMEDELSDEVLRRGFLKQCFTNASGGVMEGSSHTLLEGSAFCTMENIEIYGGMGYEFSQGLLGVKSTIVYGGDRTLATWSHGYVRPDGTVVAARTIVTRDGASLVEKCHDGDTYLDDCANVCLVTSPLTTVDFGYSRVRPNGERIARKTAADFSFYGMDQAKIYGGALPEAFVCFYDASGNVVRWVKSHANRPIKIPAGAKTLRMTCYAYCDTEGNIVMNGSAVKSLDARGIGGMKLRAVVRPTGNKYLNCKVSHTKSIALNGCAAQSLFRGCTFSHIQSDIDIAFRLTPMLMDIEENHRVGNVIGFYDNEVTDFAMAADNLHGNPQSVVSVGASDNVDARRNIGLGWAGSTRNSYFADNRMSVFRLTPLKRDNNSYRNIVKRNVVCYQHMLRYSQNRKAKDEPTAEALSSWTGTVDRDIVLEETLVCATVGGDNPVTPRGDLTIVRLRD